ncbi:hypothetical protein KY328_00640 [Candidatus Woesearchaeota archaeon]|nr:hypothetical protein [Candidatus Woesearchaeota archaeon]MBW3021404.1 hypothetical protein [Candidatus Woesearchaeota archaeon]
MAFATPTRGSQDTDKAQSIKKVTDLDIVCQSASASKDYAMTEAQYVRSLALGVPLTMFKGMVVKLFYDSSNRFDKCGVMELGLGEFCYEIGSNLYQRAKNDGIFHVTGNILENMLSLFI